jgi:hypothetical protein
MDTLVSRVDLTVIPRFADILGNKSTKNNLEE